ncbi:MAG: lytic transglycosylase [Desulfuromonas sp.]|uniref:lytic transglycosylase domain-containing protein n=1 Tax=Desulfuromonas sp. TaxID=892 RepID=UPI000CAA550C|nr:lytic transglycosylase domain-containing protein [Desulfuromonas sp.]PLX86005.1 MAG: lytic transglycosylase [Desulfuromonas sp.]
MAINPARGLPGKGAFPAERGAPHRGHGKDSAFENALESLLRKSEKGFTPSVDGPALARMVSLQMSRGLLGLSDGDSGGGAFSSSAWLENLRSAVARGDQNIEPSPPLPAAPEKNRALSLYKEDSANLDAIVEKAASRFGLEPRLVRSVIRAESDFDTQAVSPAGARGLMQLMPATAQELGVRDSFDPEQNVMGGTRYLRQLLDRYDGDLDSALAAYNWGPGNLDRSDGTLPGETRRYLARVKGFLAGPPRA